MGSWFPEIYDAVMKPLEVTRFKKIRKSLVGDAQGKVLEIGSGTGINFSYYQDASQVIAIEPNKSMAIRSQKRLEQAQVPITIVESDAESLPFDDNTFDTIIATLVFCTITDPEKALLEIRRVSKNGAKLFFFEHVRMSHPVLGKMQDLLNPSWTKKADGCNLNRDTLSNIRESGINIRNVKSMYGGLFLTIHCWNEK